MHMVRHHDEGMQLITVECAIAVLQRRHHHPCNFWAPKKQGANGACVQEPIDGYECLARRDEPGWREHSIAGQTAMQSEGDKQRLIDYVPMRQAPYIVPHTFSLYIEGGETLTALSRLKAGCGQDCPHSI